MIAALPMYDWPEIRPATDAFWQRLRERLAREGITGPQALTRELTAAETWAHPELLLGQTCGWPLTHGLAGASVPVARPIHDVPGCGVGVYRSAVIVRTGEDRPLDTLRVAVNGPDSLSGYHALRRWLARRSVEMAPHLVTGGHRASVAAVRDGKADLAAIDAVSWELARRHEGVRGLERLGWTEEAPALPFITAPGGPAAALARALARPGPEIAAAIGLVGILPAGMEDYAALGGW
ncbi:phosphate/phosphite/phosphonate ABC transporter substrate-binding protein [Oceanicella sp. SM1341]|uniref:phosphate/phosphite/phosphonate ABC transporter substrate-binding protein n=1 Tax=Oceanicella sp. SM1341 TaxID=1548889 RepID=UPI000E52EE1E|nr:PhnD/SsuA/transferrin family substrate-binding protein [Oceanicella sp. SM1341]